MKGIAMPELDLDRRTTVLVVDDTPDNLALMGLLLKDTYKVKVANSGDIALKIAASDAPPDLILLDIMMPDMDGYEVCRRLKLDPKTMGIPVIFLTAKAEMEDEKRGLELGAVDYVTKPISPPIVMARVKNHLCIKAMADFLKEKNIELENARNEAEKANLAKSDFLSSMSHELRSPLNAILGFAQLLESDPRPPTLSQKGSITQILHSGWHLLKLINEILDLAKVEARQIPLSNQPVSMSEVLLECMDMISPQAQKRGIKMIPPKGNISYLVLADQTRVKQVLINLLSNAVKYNALRGTVEVKCEESSLGRIRVTVTDTGAGLSPEQLPQLFQAFNRLDQETGSEEGTGIGLVVAKRLVELMGGEIGATSTLGIGSTFWFELNSAPEGDLVQEGCDVGTSIELRESKKKEPHTLLYIEDDSVNINLVEQVISRYPDLRLLTARNGKCGIEMASSLTPDLILIDLDLPDLDGFEIIRHIKSEPATAAIPIIAISADASPRSLKKGMDAGFFGYVTQPLVVDEFIPAIHSALDFGSQASNSKHLANAFLK